MENGGKDISSPLYFGCREGREPQLITEEPMEEPVYKVVEVMPEFPGGMKALMDFIQRISVIRKKSGKNGIQGRVAVSVVIDEEWSCDGPRYYAQQVSCPG